MRSEEKQNISHFKMYGYLLKSLREYKKTSILSLLVSGLQACSDCSIPLLLGFMINEMNNFQSNGGDSSNIVLRVVMYAVILLLLTVFSFTMSILGANLSSKAACGLAKNLRQDLFYKTQDFSFENIDDFTKASLVTRQTSDISNIMFSYMMILRNMMLSPVYLIYSLVASLIVAASLSWVYAVIIPVIVVIGLSLTLLALKYFSKAFEKIDEFNKTIEENVQGIRTVKTYAREDYEKKKFNKASDAIMKILTKGEISANLTNPLMNVTINISMALLVTFGAYGILRGNMLVGAFSTLTNYAVYVLFSLMMLAMIMVTISMSLASSKRVYEVLNEQTTIDNNPNAIKEISDGSIEFKHVFFRYKGNKKDEYVLKDINLSIKSGQTIGIIGSTGSAKSSLVNLIPRFYDPEKGEVLVGGRNIKDYDKKVLRDEVSMVLQKNVLFSGTLLDNIRWGKEDASTEEVEEVCKIAQADEFIQLLPGKYEYKVEQGGTNFSGGQKQRLCIARALIKKPKVLIFDDSTSAVDTKTDAKIREGLRRTLPGVTKIIIAQRISSVLDTDQIIVMDNGSVSAMGKAKDLYHESQIFKEVCDIQGISEVNL